MIDPLGGTLVERRLDETLVDVEGLPSLQLDAVALADLELISNGAYSPLAGFMPRDDYNSVVQHASLAGGVPWTLPITLPVPAAEAATLKEGIVVALRDGQGAIRGTMEVQDVFERDLELEASEVYRTTDPAHPGVRTLLSASEVVAGGTVNAIPYHHANGAMTPAQTRDEFARRGWSTVVAFQTRNPVHRAHEYLTKVALEQVDGLLLHPLSGATKDDDVPFDVRMQCYRVLLDRYYVPDRVVLALFPAAMRYAGPREAVYHGLVRRNYGCSHFIIGRDAAGVGSYYGPYDAQHLYDELGGAERLGFTALKFEHAFYCRACEAMASTRTCPHGPADRVALSGTRLREMLAGGEEIPVEFSRPEVAAILRAAYTGSREEAPA